MAHMGGYYHYEAVLQAAGSCRNLYVDTSAIPYPWISAKQWRRSAHIGCCLPVTGPGCLPALEVEKVRLAELASEDEALVFSGNIQRLLEEVRHDL